MQKTCGISLLDLLEATPTDNHSQTQCNHSFQGKKTFPKTINEDKGSNLKKLQKNEECKEMKEKEIEFVEREGDWICLVCGNHNFAFRGFCNRCVFQEKEKNILQCRQILWNLSCNPGFLLTKELSRRLDYNIQSKHLIKKGSENESEEIQRLIQKFMSMSKKRSEKKSFFQDISNTGDKNQFKDILVEPELKKMNFEANLKEEKDLFSFLEVEKNKKYFAENENIRKELKKENIKLEAKSKNLKNRFLQKKKKSLFKSFMPSKNISLLKNKKKQNFLLNSLTKLSTSTTKKKNSTEDSLRLSISTEDEEMNENDDNLIKQKEKILDMIFDSEDDDLELKKTSCLKSLCVTSKLR